VDVIACPWLTVFPLAVPRNTALRHLHQPPDGLGLVCTFLAAYPAKPSRPHRLLSHGVSNLSTTTMNGMSRFLSRRDKHHDKRVSKHANTKVRPSSFASVNSLSPLLRPAVDTVRDDSPARPRRLSSSIETLYHKLPFSLRTSVEDSFLFLNRQFPGRASPASAVVNQIPATSSSDYMPLQSSPQNVSPDLYRIFTSEGPRPPASKDGDQKVCVAEVWPGLLLMCRRSRCS
jgi:hypothetical protein